MPERPRPARHRRAWLLLLLGLGTLLFTAVAILVDTHDARAASLGDLTVSVSGAVAAGGETVQQVAGSVPVVESAPTSPVDVPPPAPPPPSPVVDPVSHTAATVVDPVSQTVATVVAPVSQTAATVVDPVSQTA